MNKLPDIPSDLILVALHDLELCEADPNYKIEMSEWHNYNSEISICEVCLAGSVLAKDLNLDKVNDNYVYVNLPKETEDKLSAINNFRTGYIKRGFIKMGLGEISFNHRRIADYEINPLAFKEDMTNLAFELWEAGY